MQSDTFKDQFTEHRVTLGRAVAATLIVCAALGGLVARLTYLQISNHTHYETLSQENRIKLVPIPPTRGMIYDRNGIVLANNVPTFTLEITPERVEDMDKTLAELGRLIDISEDELQRFHQMRKRMRRFEKVTLKSQLTEKETAKLAVQHHRFPGVDITVSLLREYPLKELTSHVVGYLGRISEKDLQAIDASEYSGTTHIGKSGLEKAYESDLLGKVGVQQVEINASGRVVRVLETQPPLPGRDLHPYLDIRLQKAATEALGDYTGSIVAIDPTTGGVLALVSHPGFDPNPFVEGISHREYSALRDDPRVPLFNRAIQGKYPPGSTVKPFFGLAGLELGTITPQQTTYCPGSFQLKGTKRVFRDWKRGGHGYMNMDDAITKSCDVFFYDLAHGLGIDRIHEYLGQFQFGQATGIDLPLETTGTLPSKNWKRGRYGQPWLPGDTINVGIGQGYFQASPTQLAYATAVLAAKGRKIAPRLAASVGNDSTQTPEAQLEQIPVRNPGNWSRVEEAMIHVVEKGTARRIKTDSFHIAGKTGTAQVFTLKQHEVYDEKKLEKEKHDHALFVSYAPVDEPRIAVSVIVENGGHGGATAAPVARKVLDYYLRDILGLYPPDPATQTMEPDADAPEPSD